MLYGDFVFDCVSGRVCGIFRVREIEEDRGEGAGGRNGKEGSNGMDIGRIKIISLILDSLEIGLC